jgi:rubrerythrin
MSDQIEQNIARAFAEESKAAARNRAFELKAEKDGFPEIARLFRAMADADAVHARRFLGLMRGKIGKTEENLRESYNRESLAKEAYYPPMVEVAKGASKAVKKAFIQSMHTDGEHAEIYKAAMEDMLAGSDRVYYVCQICGHIHIGEIPENCPVCQAVPGRFKKMV